MAMLVPHLSSSSTQSVPPARSGTGSAAPSAAPIASSSTTRGGTGSPACRQGLYTLAQLGHDALAILDAEGIATAHVCGLSLGGITALWLAVHAPDRVRSLTMANTGARIGSAEFWDARMALVRERGMTGGGRRGDSQLVHGRLPGAGARSRAAVPRRHRVHAGRGLSRLQRSDAVSMQDLRESLHAVRCPVLAIAGASDRSTPPELLQFGARTAAGLAARHAAGRASQQRRAGDGLQRRPRHVPRRAHVVARLQTRRLGALAPP